MLVASRKFVKAEFPPGIVRYARVIAAWTLNPETWIPVGDAIEKDPFDSAEAQH